MNDGESCGLPWADLEHAPRHFDRGAADLERHAIRQLILERRSASEIRQAATEQGMTLLRESALAKVLSGVTTLSEINKVTFVQ